MSYPFEEQLAPWAALPSKSRGRLYPEEETPERSPFQRDRDRVIHCATFRRLKHKTQVFVFHEGDYYRTRLTHSIEVAQIGRSLARTLTLNEDLVEALSLAHDFGHTAFGHAGEEALDQCMAPFGGFDHNAQSLRLVTTLEERYAAHPGLNLTWETLEGLAKHNGPLWVGEVDAKNPPGGLPYGIREYLPLHDLEVHTWPSLEAQVAAISDDVAYNNHDIEDGIRAGLFTLDDIGEVNLVGNIVRKVRDLHAEVSENILIHETVRRLIGRMIADIVHETRRRLAKEKLENSDDVRAAGRALVGFSSEMEARDKELKAFLNTRMYRHHRVKLMASKGRRVVNELFNLYISEPDLLPPDWAAEASTPDSVETARLVADFIAGMTDRFALREHRKLFDITALEI